MNEGEIGLADLVQSDGSRKRRPVVLLRQMPGYSAKVVDNDGLESVDMLKLKVNGNIER